VTPVLFGVTEFTIWLYVIRIFLANAEELGENQRSPAGAHQRLLRHSGPVVEYRLAPEHKFPAGLMDALGAYRWLLDNGYKAESIGILGDSAGGWLALALALSAREDGLPLPGAIAVLSPSTDMRRTGDTQTTLAEFDPILGSGAGTPAHVYAGDVSPTNPLVSPVYGDFRGFGPLLIIASGNRLGRCHARQLPMIPAPHRLDLLPDPTTRITMPEKYA
jgi:acetyl esterase/lipase